MALPQDPSSADPLVSQTEPAGPPGGGGSLMRKSRGRDVHIGKKMVGSRVVVPNGEFGEVRRPRPYRVLLFASFRS